MIVLQNTSKVSKHFVDLAYYHKAILLPTEFARTTASNHILHSFATVVIAVSVY